MSRLRIFNRHLRPEAADVPGGSEGTGGSCQPGAELYADTGTPADDIQGIPVGVFAGYRGVSPHAIIETMPGAVSKQYDDSPVTFARYNMSRGVHDVQLSNGWQQTNYGHRTIYASSGYLNEVMPQIPGQSRLSGQGVSAGFVPRGPAPGQMQNITDQVQSQPSNPGGPGQMIGKLAFGGARG